MQASRFITRKWIASLLFNACVITLSSCSYSSWLFELDRKELVKENIFSGRENREALLHHTQNIYEEFANTNALKISVLNNKTQRYLNALLKKNEFGEVRSLNFKFHLYNAEDVFYFISPLGEVVLSKGLVDKFIQTEDILKVIIYECFLRHKYGAFVYQDFPNTGYKTAQNLSKILILNLPQKISLNKWLYQLLKFNNADTSSLLDWVQSKNRKSLESRLISSNRDFNLKEEQEIKEYILKNGIFNDSDNLEMQNKAFFRFKRELLN